MQENWVVSAKRADFNAIGEKFHIDPVIARLIRNRDVVGDENIDKYLHGTLADLHNPETMKGMPEAADFILTSIRDKKKIRVIGDYDIDGIMSSYVLLTGLRRLGADVDVRIPDRIRDGYGLNEHLVRQAAEDGIERIVTCDNGISAAAQIALANELGIQTVVTDHHEVPYTMVDGEKNYILPPAKAVIDPKQVDCQYPFKGLCGAGVAWKLISYLYQLSSIPQAEAEELLEFVGFATIGDIMDLVDENRIIVREGLHRMHHTKNAGLLELILQNGYTPEQIDTYHIGFILGPCLNATGRLDTATRALQLLCAESQKDASILAGDLIALNTSRKDMTAKGQEEAIRLVETTDLMNDRVLVVYMPEVHESLAGIIAGRLKEHFYRPSFVLTKTEDGRVKGSGRSIEAYSMYDEMCKVRELYLQIDGTPIFGGHPMAAGLSLPEENVDIFRRRMNEECTLTEADMTPKVVIDVPMPVGYVREDLIHQLDLLRPFGAGNKKPIFAESKVQLVSLRVLGKNRNFVKMQVLGANGSRIEGTYFGDGDAFAEEIRQNPVRSIIYYPEINEYRGQRTLQVRITSYR